ncbi:hypothetical protein Agub_g13476 [Astrephomene gubernaculifera]|uniref:FHA domain-containing protein n=1 Tax=Astrephomene gubernaculifera TaxID=47775 RepID=A0AAD3HRH1_9CHLO|nr:hypothetical protein Agub_g13476 [Astrephomene gubernaculifera]
MAMAASEAPLAKIDIAVPSRLKLSVTEGPCKGQVIESTSFNSLCLTVGRIAKRAKIYLKDKAISEKHAEMAWDGQKGAWLLRDTDSSNGTRLNHASLEPFFAHPLKSGDFIKFGTDTVAEVTIEPRSLCDATVEELLRAFFETRCQELEEETTQAPRDMLQRCQEAFSALLAPPQQA